MKFDQRLSGPVPPRCPFLPAVRCGIRRAALLLLCLMGLASQAWSDAFFELAPDGSVIARGDDKTGYASVVQIPAWVPPAQRANPAAQYYLYWGEHSGSHIRLKWSSSAEGPWTTFNLGGFFNGRSRRGVLAPMPILTGTLFRISRRQKWWSTTPIKDSFCTTTQRLNRTPPVPAGPSFPNGMPSSRRPRPSD